MADAILRLLDDPDAVKASVWREVAGGRRAAGAGDVPGDRVDRLELAPVALRRPGVQQQPGAGELGGAAGVQQRAPAGPRSEVARLGLGNLGGHLLPGRDPAVVAAVEDAHVGVAVVAEQPPGSRGG